MDADTFVPPDYTGYSNEELDDHLGMLCSHAYATIYQLLCVIREWVSRDLGGNYGVKSPAHWLNYRYGIALGAAREKVRVALALEHLPKVSALFARGELSYSKVRALTRIATARNEDCLISFALNGTASHLEKTVALYRRTERTLDPQRFLNQRLHRGVDWYWDDDGMFILKARLSAEDGALLIRAIEAMKDHMYREERARDSDDRLEFSQGRIEHDVVCPATARRADALLRLVESGCKGEPQALSGAERVQVVLHVPVSTSRAEPDEDEGQDRNPLAQPPVARLDPGPPVTEATARRLCCDASRVVMAETETGDPLSIGRRSRIVSWQLRKALEHRDGGCTFPGCTEHRYVDAHHIRHWADGGETSLDNLTLLCRTHHRLVHEDGFGCERLATGELEFRLPNGEVLPPAFRLKPVTYIEAVRLHERQGLDISAATYKPGWDGYRWDMEHVQIVLGSHSQTQAEFRQKLTDMAEAYRIHRERASPRKLIGTDPEHEVDSYWSWKAGLTARGQE